MSVRFRFYYNCMRILCVPILFLIGFITPVLSSNNLPSGWTELEYIESNGKQYIDTGLAPNDYYTEIIFSPLGITDKNYNFILGAENIWNSRNNPFYWNTSTFGYSFRNIYGPIPNMPIIFGKKYIAYSKVISGNYSLSIDDTIVQTLTTTGEPTSNTLYIFADNADDTPYYFAIAKLYSLKLWDNSLNSIANFIPARRNSDNVVGMYDTVSQTFFTNAGTGTFIAGSEVGNQESENTEIKIATTKYVEDAFADSVSELNTTMGTIKSVVDNTIIQADRIGKLHTGKQTRPDERCPYGRDCLLITEADGTLHWYPICDGNGSVEPLPFDVSVFLAQLTVNGDNYYFNGNTTTYNALGKTGSAYIKQPSLDSIVHQLQETEWAVLWNNTGVVYGTSVCNGNSGTFAVASSSEQTESKGKNCWCKMTSVGDTDKVEHSVSGSAWVFDGAYGSAADCADYCAADCAHDVRIYASFRSAVVGVGN